MQDGQRPMRKKSYSFVEEPMAKDLEPGSPFKQVSVPSQVSPDRQRLFLNTFSVRDIWNGPDSHSQRLELMMAQSLSSGPEDHLFPFEVMEKNAKVHSLSDFVLAMILSYLGYCADTPAFLECKLKIERALTDRLDQSELGARYEAFRTDLAEGRIPIFCEQLLLIDCRFKYEFDAGHVIGSINISDPNVLQLLFVEKQELATDPSFLKRLKVFSDRTLDLESARSLLQNYKPSAETLVDSLQQLSVSPQPPLLQPPLWTNKSTEEGFRPGSLSLSGEDSGSRSRLDNLHQNDSISLLQLKKRNPVLVFYCEFSSQRAPDMWKFLRQADRAMNPYPHLCYSDIYVLRGGYHSFVKAYPELCCSIFGDTELYVKMWDKRFAEECAVAGKKLAQDWALCGARKGGATSKPLDGFSELRMVNNKNKRFSACLAGSESLFKLFTN